MADVWSWALIAGPVLVFSAAATLVWSRHARGNQWLDQPGARRLHTEATPRGGGIGIFGLALLAMLVLAMAVPEERRYWLLAGLGLFVCAGAGLLDDLRKLSNQGKFALQLAAALMLAAASQTLSGASEAGVNGAGIAAFTLLVVNFVNFMDGSNGLVSLQAVLLTMALSATGSLAEPALMLAMVVLAATLGFLPFNFPKARVFLGDVGSHALGYCLALLFIRSWGDGHLGWVPSLLLLSAILMDAGLTLAVRVASGQRFWQAHCEHLYQWALRVGISPVRVAVAYAAWTMLAAATAFALHGASAHDQVVAAGAAVAVSSILYVGLKWRWAGRLRQEPSA